MTNDEFLRKCILQAPDTFGLQTEIRENDIGVLLRAPEVESRSRRVGYYVYIKKSSQPSLIAQVSLSKGELDLPCQNPYIPAEGLNHLQDILPHPAGALSNAGRRIYWARFIPWQSLKAEFENAGVLLKVAQRVTKSPWKDAGSKGSPIGLMQYARMSRRVCSLLEDLRPLEDNLVHCFQEYWTSLYTGFSHGDLWPQDILCTPDGELCILDWEWFSPARPMGYDLFHLAVSTLECGYQQTTSEALTQLIYGIGEQEMIFRQFLGLIWDALEYSLETRYASVLAYLVDIQHQVLEQAARSPSRLDLEAARALGISLSDREYLAPLLHKDTS